MNELEKYQFEVLKRYVLEPDWLDQLTLEYNWSNEQSNTFANILEKFDDKENFTHNEFEAELFKNLNIDYQNTKHIIRILYEKNRCDRLVRQFINSMRNKNSPLSSEYLDIEKELFGNNVGK